MAPFVRPEHVDSSSMEAPFRNLDATSIFNSSVDIINTRTRMNREEGLG
jgi:hypothetical protein